MFSPAERAYVEAGRLGRLATADPEGRPSVIPVCYAFVDEIRLATPIDEKPKRVGPTDLRRVRDITANPTVALVVDHYREDWDRLGWVQIRGTATLLQPSAADHGAAVAALEAKYDQYADHDLDERPMIEIEPGSVLSWGSIARDVA